MATRQALAAIDTNVPRHTGLASKQPHLSPSALRKQVEERCQEIMRQAEDAAMALEQELQIQLVKIPKKVRQMSLREFQEAFDGNVSAAAVSGELSSTGHPPVAATPTASIPATGSRTTRKARVAEQPSSTRSTRKRPGASDAVGDGEEEPKTAAPSAKRGRAVPLPELKTPAPNIPTAAVAPGTAAREAAPGEMAYSSRGSPILIPSSAMHPGTHSRLPASQRQASAGLPTISLTTCSRTRTAARTARAQAKAAAEKEAEEHQDVTHGIVLTTEDGRQIPLENGLTALPADMQQAATQQLQSLKGLVDNLLQASQGAAPIPAADPKEEPRGDCDAQLAGTSASHAAALPPVDLKQIRKGKWMLLRAKGQDKGLTQPAPEKDGLGYAVAKVLGRTGAKAKVQFYAPEGSGDKWAEGPKKSEEITLELPDVLAVFDSLTRKDKSVPAEAMEQMRARLGPP